MSTKRFSLYNILFLAVFIIPIIGFCQTSSHAEQHWLPYINFEPTKFSNPPKEFCPFVRWWWPGNNVDSNELKREVRLLADNGFGGVEIQPFGIGVNPHASQNKLNRWYSWDSESFYKNVAAVMRQARESGIIVDMTAGSGWPLVTPVTTPESGMQMFTYADTVFTGGQEINIPLPQNIYRIKNAFRTYDSLQFSLAHLQEVFAAPIIKRDSAQIFLDKEEVKIITGSIINKRIKWRIPDGGKWEIIAIYSIPSMEANPFAASKKPLYVVNQWDSTKIQSAYNYLFGKRTGLEEFYGNPMRAIFNDSYEFKPTVHFAKNIFSEFKKENGYDLEPWLPQVMKSNTIKTSFLKPDLKSKFVLTDEGKRIKYDFNKTMGNILIDQLIVGSDHWAEERGLLHRTQPYGPIGLDVNLNVIKAAGKADIPGTEQLYDGGTEGFLKLVTSGAHLYNRPVIGEETFVFWDRAFMTTPQKLKVLSEKAFTAGVNQIIYHGFPYKLMTNNYGIEGWSPFNSPYGNSDYSSHINEVNPFWKYIKEVNTFISRSQYILRSGHHKADVLIYDPGITSQVGPNPEEILVGGYFKGVEPKDGADIREVNEKDNTFWETVNKLDAAGITWDYVDNASLQQAKIVNGKIDVRGNSYAAIILPQIPYAPLPIAQKMAAMAKKGMNLLVIGDLPTKQPDFLNYKINDKKTDQLFVEVVRQVNSHQLANAGLMDSWVSKLPRAIRFKNNYSFIRQSERELKDGGLLDYLWNLSDQWQTVSLEADGIFNHFYWLNPTDGDITACGNNREDLSYQIPPYSSVVLFATINPIPSRHLSTPPLPIGQAKSVVQIKNWDITIGDTTLRNCTLFDWRSNKGFEYKSTDGIYDASFNMDKKEDEKYYLDLGKVFFTAKVFINGQNAGTSIWAPYMLDVTDLIHSGENKIEIRVTPTLLNELIGLGKSAKKDEKYFLFKGREAQLMPAGLIGPVVIKSL